MGEFLEYSDEFFSDNEMAKSIEEDVYQMLCSNDEDDASQEKQL